MRLTEIILFSLSVALFIIGVHQIFTVGMAESYWIVMLSFLFLLLYKWKKEKALPESAQKNADATSASPESRPAKGSARKPTGAKQVGRSGGPDRSNQNSRK
jgi:hypothetical protein